MDERAQGLSHVIHVPILELRAPHAIHVIFHGEVIFHGARRAVTSLDLVDTAEAVAHQAKYPFLVVLRTFRISRACRTCALIQERIHFFLLIVGA